MIISIHLPLANIDFRAADRTDYATAPLLGRDYFAAKDDA